MMCSIQDMYLMVNLNKAELKEGKMKIVEKKHRVMHANVYQLGSARSWSLLGRPN